MLASSGYDGLANAWYEEECTCGVKDSIIKFWVRFITGQTVLCATIDVCHAAKSSALRRSQHGLPSVHDCRAAACRRSRLRLQKGDCALACPLHKSGCPPGSARSIDGREFVPHQETLPLSLAHGKCRVTSASIAIIARHYSEGASPAYLACIRPRQQQW